MTATVKTQFSKWFLKDRLKKDINPNDFETFDQFESEWDTFLGEHETDTDKFFAACDLINQYLFDFDTFDHANKKFDIVCTTNSEGLNLTMTHTSPTKGLTTATQGFSSLNSAYFEDSLMHTIDNMLFQINDQ